MVPRTLWQMGTQGMQKTSTAFTGFLACRMFKENPGLGGKWLISFDSLHLPSWCREAGDVGIARKILLTNGDYPFGSGPWLV